MEDARAVAGQDHVRRLRVRVLPKTAADHDAVLVGQVVLDAAERRVDFHPRIVYAQLEHRDLAGSYLPLALRRAAQYRFMRTDTARRSAADMRCTRRGRFAATGASGTATTGRAGRPGFSRPARSG